MITAISRNKITSSRGLNAYQKSNQNTNFDNSNSLKLSGFNSPMKSYISFGWCTGHYQGMYDIDMQFSEVIEERLAEIERLKTYKKKRVERYSIVDDNSILAAKILAQYVNLQCVIAEVPPSYGLYTAGQFKNAMNKSETFTNPLSSLIAINAITKMEAKNLEIDESHLERGKGATQLYAISILLNQINENKNKPEFKNNIDHIEALTSMTEGALKEIYGDDILERLEYFGKMGKNPTNEQKAAALDFLIEIDSKARSINLGKEFENRLEKLIELQNEEENLTKESVNKLKSNFKMTIQYPDHDHSVMHAHGIPHTHDHTHHHNHTHPHEHESYEQIIKNAKEREQQNKTIIDDDNNKKLRIKEIY